MYFIKHEMSDRMNKKLTNMIMHYYGYAKVLVSSAHSGIIPNFDFFFW